MCFSERFSELLRKGDISPREISERIGVSEDVIYSCLTGERKPTLTLAILLANVLNVTAEDLLTAEEIRKVPEGDILKLNEGQRRYLEKLMNDCNRRISPVKELRVRTGLSQGEFASRYGISLCLLQKWETAKEIPTRMTLAALTEAVNKDFPRSGHLNRRNRPEREKSLHITFDRRELFILTIVKHLNRAGAFIQVQKLIIHEPNQDMIRAKQGVLLMLPIMSDRDYRNIDTQKCFEGWDGYPSYDGLGDFEAEIRGIMSEDGVVLREPLPGESEMILTELDVMRNHL